MLETCWVDIFSHSDGVSASGVQQSNASTARFCTSVRVPMKASKCYCQTVAINFNGNCPRRKLPGMGGRFCHTRQTEPWQSMKNLVFQSPNLASDNLQINLLLQCVLASTQLLLQHSNRGSSDADPKTLFWGDAFRHGSKLVGVMETPFECRGIRPP